MLELLHIENIAVIQEADIQFRPGFNALTGETGASVRSSPRFPPACRGWRRPAPPRTRTVICCCSGS